MIADDYNGDGLVNAADYTVWRDAVGQQGSGLAADGDGDNVIGNGDYSVWSQNYGSGSNATTHAIPEPNLCAAFLLATAIMTKRNR